MDAPDILPPASPLASLWESKIRVYIVLPSIDITEWNDIVLASPQRMADGSTPQKSQMKTTEPWPFRSYTASGGIAGRFQTLEPQSNMPHPVKDGILG